MRQELPASHYTGKGYLKKGRFERYIPLYRDVASLLPPPDSCPRILDLGCGIGYFAKIIHSLGYLKYLGIDFSEDVLKLARDNMPLYEYVLMDLYSDNLAEFIKDYKCFTMIETLEHLSNDLDVLNKIPSGAIIVGSVPSVKSLGHVRSFRGLEDVFNRYQSILHFNFFNEIKINSKKLDNIITIFRGIKK